MNAAQKLTLRFLFLPFLLGAFDAGVTLYYQPGNYWSGHYMDAHDGNPFVLLALRIHPALMIPGTLAWYAITWFLLCHTSAWIALRSYVVLIIGHTIGGCGWLYRYHPQGAWLYLVVALAALVTAAWVIAPYLRYWSAEGTLRSLLPSSETGQTADPVMIEAK